MRVWEESAWGVGMVEWNENVNIIEDGLLVGKRHEGKEMACGVGGGE